MNFNFNGMMKRILGRKLLGGVVVCGMLLGGLATVPAVLASGADPAVYVCTGKYATSYHSTAKCKGLGNCKASVKSISRSSAVKAGRKPCKACW